MGAVGIPEPLHLQHLGGVAPDAPAGPVLAPPVLIRLPQPRYQPGQFRLGLFLSPTLISVVLSCGASTTLLRLHCPLQFLVPLTLSFMLPRSPRFCPYRMAPMLILCQLRLAIMLNIGWSELRSGFGQLFLRLSVVFL
ncbi:ORF3 [Chirohepevirus eptesici]|uniref:ORF3 n=1 Tax=Chirohepevirus eptesici TaxID=1678146 RepID=A0A1S6LQY7_9VIRU|nr:ORF3 [Chirohepevirus eptesici]